MVVEFSSQSTLGSSACSPWHKVFLPSFGVSSSQPIDLDQHYLFEEFDAGLCVEAEAMLENK